MGAVVAIAKKQNVNEILDEIAERDDIEELLTVYRYRDEEGAIQWGYAHSGGDNRMATVGVLHWIANELLESE